MYKLSNVSTLPSFDPYQASNMNIKGDKEKQGVPVYTPNLNCRVGKNIAEPFSLKLLANGGKLPEKEKFYGIRRDNKALDKLLAEQNYKRKTDLQLLQTKPIIDEKNKKNAMNAYFEEQYNQILKQRQKDYAIAGLPPEEREQALLIERENKNYFKNALRNTPAQQFQNRLSDAIMSYFAEPTGTAGTSLLSGTSLSSGISLSSTFETGSSSLDTIRSRNPLLGSFLSDLARTETEESADEQFVPPDWTSEITMAEDAPSIEYVELRNMLSNLDRQSTDYEDLPLGIQTAMKNYLESVSRNEGVSMSEVLAKISDQIDMNPQLYTNYFNNLFPPVMESVGLEEQEIVQPSTSRAPQLRGSSVRALLSGPELAIDSPSLTLQKIADRVHKNTNPQAKTIHDPRNNNRYVRLTTNGSINPRVQELINLGYIDSNFIMTEEGRMTEARRVVRGHGDARMIQHLDEAEERIDQAMKQTRERMEQKSEQSEERKKKRIVFRKKKKE
jgi:hypothetical protein